MTIFQHTVIKKTVVLVINVSCFNHVIGYDQRIICANFQIHILKHAVEIQEKLNRQSLLFHPVCGGKASIIHFNNRQQRHLPRSSNK